MNDYLIYRKRFHLHYSQKIIDKFYHYVYHEDTSNKDQILFNALSHTATFSCGLRYLENGLLNVRQPTDVSATISHPELSVLPTTKCLGE